MTDDLERLRSLPADERAALERALLERAAASARPHRIEPAARDRELPLSFGQERLWFLDWLQPGSAEYNMPAKLRLSGPLAVQALADAFRVVVERHEALRTSFPEHDGRPVQRIAPPGPFPLPVLDVSERDVARLGREEALRPFDLATGPLIRAQLLRLGPEEHVLLLTLHHVVCDGWSIEVLVRELSDAYPALCAGATPKLPPLPIQYGDFAVWQRGFLSAERLRGQIEHWRERLAGVPPLELPTERPRPAVRTGRGGSVAFWLPAELVASLEALARSYGATLFMTLLAALQTLLARHSGQDDFAVGTPIANRTRTETERLIGFFTNVLVLRGDLSGDPSFVELLARTRATALGAYENQDLPFEQLVEQLNPARDLSRPPLFQVLLTLQNPPEERLRLPGLELEWLLVEREVARFDLELTLLPARRGGLDAMLTYAADLFDRETAAHFGRHFERLLRSIVADPTLPLSRLSLLDERERERLLVGWNATEAALPELTVPELVAAQARRTPAAVALESAGARLTYAELEARAERLAGRLRALGVGPGSLVGVCLERSPELVVALLGVMKAGGAYLPLDPALPEERLRFMLDDSAAPVLVTDEGSLPVPSGFEGEIVVPEGDGAWSEATAAARADDLAYVLYTSGSTGRPKGVEVTQRSLVNLLLALAEQPGLGPHDRLLALTTVSFDIAALELFLPLLRGATLVLAPRGAAADPRLLLELLHDTRPTVVQATPSTWKLLAAAGWRGPRLRRILCGGERLEPELARELALRSDELWNLYGPTETTIWSLAARLDTSPVSVPIGRPIANTQAYVLDAALEPVPVGIPGELYLGGAGVARGYHGRRRLTAERFVPDPFGRSGGRLYRTGDRVRFLSDGRLEFLGRLDEQVKIRGYRVEPGEVEARLREHPAVAEAVVVLREDEPDDPRLVGYVVAAGGGSVPPGDLRGFLKQTLPEYMVPAAFMPLESLPLTPNGKLDRRRLPAPRPAAPDTSERSWSTETERRLAAICAALLGLASIGPDDDFFELGGYSLLTIRLVGRLRAELGVELPLRVVFEERTVRRLAAAVDDASARPGARPAPELVRLPRQR